MSTWITLPPFVSLPVAVALFFLGGQAEPQRTGAPFWVLLIIVYFILSGAYAVAIRKRLFSLLTPLQLLSQGLIATMVSLESGTLRIISWIGVAAAVSGSFMLLNHLLNGKENPGKDDHPSLQRNGGPDGTSFLEKMPLPALTTDSRGIIAEGNGAFVSLVPGRIVAATPVTEFFIPGEQTASINGREYVIFQAPLNDLFFFALIELPKERKNPGKAKGPFFLRDEGTGLYSAEYASLRIAEELSRAFRYRRWLSGVLLSVEYTYIPGLNYQKDKENAFMKAFSGFISDTIRDSDMAFSLDDRRILILLPETPQQGAKDVSMKLKELPDSLLELKDSFPFSVGIEYGFLYYSGNYPMNKDQFLEKISSTLGGSAE